MAMRPIQITIKLLTLVITLVITIVIYTATVRSVSLSKASRLINFSDQRPNIRIDQYSGYKLFSIFSTSTLKCSIICLLTPKCKSFNLCKPHGCQFNSATIPQLHKQSYGPVINEMIIITDPTCVYFGMDSVFIPKCQTGIKEVSIQDDPDPDENICQINSRRTDGLWGKREYFNVTKNIGNEYEAQSYQDCLPETALNDGFCPQPRKTDRIWLKWDFSRNCFFTPSRQSNFQFQN